MGGRGRLSVRSRAPYMMQCRPELRPDSTADRASQRPQKRQWRRVRGARLVGFARELAQTGAPLGLVGIRLESISEITGETETASSASRKSQEGPVPSYAGPIQFPSGTVPMADWTGVAD